MHMVTSRISQQRAAIMCKPGLDKLGLCNYLCRFLLMRVQGREVPKGIALSQALLALATQARAQGADKLARYAYSKLQV
jgi:hypothetical protein